MAADGGRRGCTLSICSTATSIFAKVFSYVDWAHGNWCCQLFNSPLLVGVERLDWMHHKVMCKSECRSRFKILHFFWVQDPLGFCGSSLWWRLLTCLTCYMQLMLTDYTWDISWKKYGVKSFHTILYRDLTNHGMEFWRALSDMLNVGQVG